MVYLDTEKYLNAVCRMIDGGAGPVPVPIRGDSMRPFLRGGDFAYMQALDTPVRPGDILLYRRETGQFVLHRVYKILSGGTLLMLGDAQLTVEPIAPDQVRARAAWVTRAGQKIGPGEFVWWFYAQPWRLLGKNRKYASKLREKFRKKK